MYNYKPTILIIFCFFILSGCSEVQIDDLDEVENIFYEKNNQNPFNGIAVSYYPNENLESETSFINGKKEGIYKEYFPTGSLKAKITYSNNNKNGPSEMYDQFGNLTIRANYKDGREHGEYEIYDNGVILQKGTIFDGKYDGLITNYLDGKKTNEITYKLGKKHGKYTRYSKEGIVKYSLNYEQDKSHGPFSTYKPKMIRVKNDDPDSWLDYKIEYVAYLYESGNIKNEEFDGPLTRYDKNGNVLEVINYKKGKKDGSHELFKTTSSSDFPKAYVSKHTSYKDGLRHGLYYENCKCSGYKNSNWCLENENKFHKKGYFKDGLLDGEFVTRKCDVSNTPIKVESYKNGLKHGKVVTSGFRIKTGQSTLYCEYINMVLENYNDGIREGEFIQYCDNGEPFLTAVYKNGRTNALSIYKENGELLHKVNCINGLIPDKERNMLSLFRKKNIEPYALRDNPYNGGCNFYWRAGREWDARFLPDEIGSYKLEI